MTKNSALPFVILSLSKDDARNPLMLRQAQHDKKRLPLVILSLSKDDAQNPLILRQAHASTSSA
jgi:hypothetical protein